MPGRDVRLPFSHILSGSIIKANFSLFKRNKDCIPRFENDHRLNNIDVPIRGLILSFVLTSYSL